jgi:glucokinase
VRYAGAVDIGGTRTKVGVVGEDGHVVNRATFPTPRAGEPAALVAGVLRVMPSVAKDLQLAGIGVAVAGFLDPARSMMTVNANLPALCGYPLRDALREALRVDVILEVDSNASTIAEHRFGVGRGARRLLGVTIGTGLGGGVVIDGQVLRHTGECAGDLGHIIVDPKGRPCTCGARGCLEAMVCAAAVSERAGRRSVAEVVRDARARERIAVGAIEETAHWLGLGLASLSPLFAPDRIVVGGGVAAAGDMLLDPTRESYRAHAASDFRDTVQIAGSTFEGWEGMIGAAAALLHRE